MRGRVSSTFEYKYVHVTPNIAGISINDFDPPVILREVIHLRIYLYHEGVGDLMMILENNFYEIL